MHCTESYQHKWFYKDSASWADSLFTLALAPIPWALVWGASVEHWVHSPMPALLPRGGPWAPAFQDFYKTVLWLFPVSSTRETSLCYRESLSLWHSCFQPVQPLLQLGLIALHARSYLWSPKDNHLAQDLGLMDACSFYAFCNWWCLHFLLILISFLLWCLSYIWRHAFMVSWGGRKSVLLLVPFIRLLLFESSFALHFMHIARPLWNLMFLGKTLFVFAAVDCDLVLYQNLKSVCWKPVCRS